MLAPVIQRAASDAQGYYIGNIFGFAESLQCLHS